MTQTGETLLCKGAPLSAPGCSLHLPPLPTQPGDLGTYHLPEVQSPDASVTCPCWDKLECEGGDNIPGQEEKKAETCTQPGAAEGQRFAPTALCTWGDVSCSLHPPVQLRRSLELSTGTSEQLLKPEEQHKMGLEKSSSLQEL